MRLLLACCFLFSAYGVQAKTCTSAVNTKTIKVGWTAYKFTEKKAVSGELKKIELLGGKGKSAAEALMNTSFSIDPLSVESGDKGRDENIRSSFFKWMNVPLIKGYIESVNDKQAAVMLSLNGVSKSVPFTLKKEGKKYFADGEINLTDFMMQKPLEELHKICKDLHKGPDGVAKTWSSVSLSISAEVSEVCK